MKKTLRNFSSLCGPVIAGAVISFLYFHPGDLYRAYVGAMDTLADMTAGQAVEHKPSARVVINLPPLEDSREISEESGWNDTFPHVVWGITPAGNDVPWTGNKPGLIGIIQPAERPPATVVEAAAGNAARPSKGTSIGPQPKSKPISNARARTQHTVTLSKAVSARNLK